MTKYYRYEIAIVGNYKPFHLTVKESMFDIVKIENKDYFRNETGQASI